MLFWWGCKSFHFLIYNINSTSSTTLTYSNTFLFTNFPFHFLIYNIKITFYPTLKYSNILLFTTAWFTPMWYVRIKNLIGGVTCFSSCSGFLICKTCFFGRRLRYTFLSLVFWLFFLYLVCQFTLQSSSSIDISLLHLSKDIFHINIIHPDDWMFVSWNQIIFSYVLLHHHFEPQCYICTN